MSSIKISGLPIAGAITGEEYAPIVQGGTTKRAQLHLISGLSPSNTAIASILIACSDENLALTASVSIVTFRMAYNFTLAEVRASLTTAQTGGGIVTVDVNQNGVSILTTPITIDNNEKSSITAVTQPIILTNALTDDSEITIDVDQVGNGTAAGLKVYLVGTQ